MGEFFGAIDMSIFKLKSVSKIVEKYGIYNEIIRLVASNYRLDFSPIVKKSSAQSSGNGVYVSGPVGKHQFVSLYPGFYEPPPPALAVLSSDGEYCVSPDDLSLRSSSSYRIHCNSCGGYLDAAKFVKGIDPKFSSVVAPYVLGHMVNHPPKGVKPNVFPVDFYWKEFMDHAKRTVHSDNIQYVEQFVNQMNPIDSDSEDVWYVDPATLEAVPLTADCAPRVGMALVAVDAIEGSTEGTELWMDYRFDMRGDVPCWYHAVDYR